MRSATCLFLILLVLIGITGTLYAQGSHIIYGEGFSFTVKDPANWNGVFDDAHRYGLTYYFCVSGYRFANTPALIYIRVPFKNGNSVEKNLEQDMDNFRKQHEVEFSDYTPGTLKYKFAAKKYLINRKTSDYVCFIDPYEGSAVYVAFVLNGPKDICDNYLNAFQEVIQSFNWLTDRVVLPPGGDTKKPE